MHGLGNDFVVFDGRKSGIPLEPALARAVADRRLGIGCDQVIVIEPSKNGAEIAMRILLFLIAAIGFTFVVVLGLLSVLADLLELTRHRPPSIRDAFTEEDSDSDDPSPYAVDARASRTVATGRTVARGRTVATDINAAQ